ncbi:MAG: acylphosphatase [Planctomycetaceae bacterium]|nr:MAG: acylphosphatase [Planctomycetaceae bacterium]
MIPTSQTTSERVVFLGRVQGVGFRQRTRSLARRFPVIGYVRNQADGSVELVVQGPMTGVNGLIEAIEADFAGMISQSERQPWPRSEEFAGFDIRF